MRYKPVLSLADAEQILDAARREADANAWVVAIAVVDDGGHLLALRRLDGAAPMASAVARHKARSAALGRKDTRVFEDMINGGRHAYLSVPALAATMTGGLPIRVDDTVVGAVGVSGVKPDQDEQIARAGIAVLDL
ncbi:GlcG/HbpS family heme-binding protein [Salinisphaera aquimarina]|uniref:Heme-binding protein n=1 Tax=Salinisphaera aquimarina TaxID=2094031 RepID=A0ABV7EL32_9GAMM